MRQRKCNGLLIHICGRICHKMSWSFNFCTITDKLNSTILWLILYRVPLHVSNWLYSGLLCTNEINCYSVTRELTAMWGSLFLQFIHFHNSLKIMSDFQHTFICTAKVLFSNKNYAAKELKKLCVMKTNLMHYLSSVYFVNQPLHVLGIFVAHHQEAYCINTTICTCCACCAEKQNTYHLYLYSNHHF